MLCVLSDLFKLCFLLAPCTHPVVALYISPLVVTIIQSSTIKIVTLLVCAQNMLNRSGILCIVSRDLSSPTDTWLEWVRTALCLECHSIWIMRLVNAPCRCGRPGDGHGADQLSSFLFRIRYLDVYTTGNRDERG